MNEFSPIPWHIIDGVIVASDLHWVAQMELTGGEDVRGELLQNANAAHIVHCVNNHAALVNALHKAINHLDVDNLTMQTLDNELNAVLKEAQS